MDDLAIIGVSARRNGSEVVGRFTIQREERRERLPGLAAELGVRELLYLATCNRVELILRVPEEPCLRELRGRCFELLAGRRPAAGEAERTLRAWAGEGAAEHLFLVAAGLDSAQLGEREVRTQLRDALKLARRLDLAGSLVDHVATEALRTAARVHREVDARDTGSNSLADIAAEHVLTRVRESPGRVALIGVSPMTRRAGRRLRAQGVPVVVVNRTADRAGQLAVELGGSARSLASFRARPLAVEALLCATGSREPVLDRACLERLAALAPSGRPPLVLDLAIPPDVDPDDARAADLPRLDIDDLAAEAEGDRSRRLVEMAPAREIVDRALEELRRDLAERMLGPVIARLNQRYRETALEGVERLLGKELAGLPPEQGEAVSRWAQVLARRFAHIPTKGLRGLAAEAGPGAVRTFLAASGEPIFESLWNEAERSPEDGR